MSGAKRNCYDILGVARDASTETIRRAYVQLTALFEPDNPTLYGLYDEADSRALLGNIRHAYRVLSEPVVALSMTVTYFLKMWTHSRQTQKIMQI